MVITKEIIDQGKSKNGGWTKKQLSILGVSWPPEKGWQNKIIGKEIDKDTLDQFLGKLDKQLGMF